MTNSRTTEVDAVTKQLLGAFKKNDWSSETHLTGIFSELEPKSVLLTSAINRLKSESELEKYDESRDGDVRSLHYLLMGFIHHPDPTIKSAAEKVKDVFDNYGVAITGENYATQSSLVASLLMDLSEPELQPSIAAVSGCAEIIAALQTAQNNFEEVRIVYEEEKAKEGTQLNASEIKKEIVNIINNKLVTYLRAMSMVDEATYGEITRTFAQMIEDNNEVVKKRRKKPETVE